MSNFQSKHYKTDNKLVYLTDEFFMGIAFKIASFQKGYTGKNPSVGCIIVKNNKILGKFVTNINGSPHAESQACKFLIENNIEGATLYSLLEPCCHTGKNPPCVNSILSAKIKRVVISIKDPDSRVNGKGIKILQQNNIEVKLGVLSREVSNLYKGFIKQKTSKQPYIFVKVATSIDGKIALHNFESKAISNHISHNLSHYLRSKSNMIVIGVNTANKDNPTLNCRIKGKEKKKLIRCVIDPNLRINSDNNLINSISDRLPLWLCINNKNKAKEQNKIIELEKKGVKIIGCGFDKNNNLNKAEFYNMCYKHDIHEVMVEGGGKLITSFLQNKMIDKLFLISTSNIIGNDGIAAFQELQIDNLNKLVTLQIESQIHYDFDLVTEATIIYP